MEDERERLEEQPNFKIFVISNYERNFHKIHINMGRERMFKPLKGCISSRDVTLLGEISMLLKEYLKNSLIKM